MARARKRAEEGHGEGPSSERWLLTYSDMITLLMVLFIVLFAMGQTDIRKFNAFRDSFHPIEQVQENTPPGGPGVLSAPSAIALSEQNPFAKLNTSSAAEASGEKQMGLQASGQKKQGQANPGQQTAGDNQAGDAAQAAERQALANAAAKIEAALEQKGLSEDVSLTMDQRGLVVTILTDKILFPLDSAQLQPEGVEIVNAIAPVLASLPNQIDVEGDTDNQPIHGGPYASNWALSAARAVAVVQDLIDNHGIEPARMQATGDSDTRPVVPNNTSQHQAENRRVEIVILSTTLVTP